MVRNSEELKYLWDSRENSTITVALFPVVSILTKRNK
jgi:hypothetical protein